MTKLTRKERAKLIAQERALFRGMRITTQPDVARCDRLQKELEKAANTKEVSYE